MEAGEAGGLIPSPGSSFSCNWGRWRDGLGSVSRQAPEDLGKGDLSQLLSQLHPFPQQAGRTGADLSASDTIAPGDPAPSPRRPRERGGGGQEARGSSPPPSCPALRPHLWLELAAPGLGTRGTGVGEGGTEILFWPNAFLFPVHFLGLRMATDLAAPEKLGPGLEARGTEGKEGGTVPLSPSRVPGTLRDPHAAAPGARTWGASLRGLAL